MPNEETIPIPNINIIRVKDVFFEVNETVFYENGIVAINLEQSIGYKLENSLFEFTLGVFYRYTHNNELTFRIKVKNTFIIDKLEEFIKGTQISLPFETLVLIVSLSISHTRALLSNNLSGTLYQDVILPIINAVDATKTLFKPVDNSEEKPIPNEEKPKDND